MQSPSRHAAAALLIATVGLAIGCRRASPTDPIDAGNDAGVSPDTDSAADLPDGADPACSATLNHVCYPLPSSQLDVALDGEALADGWIWLFVDIGGYHGVLAARDTGDGVEPVVVFPNLDWDGGIHFGMIAILPEGVEEQIVPIAITDAPTGWDDDEVGWLYAVLGRTQSGYVVYGVPEHELGDGVPDDYEDPTGLAPVAMHQKLAGDDLGGFEPRGMALGSSPAFGETLCVFEDGVRCADGSAWSYAVAAGSGLFNAMSFEAIGETWGLVVGDDGQMVRLLDSGWQVVPTGTDDDLRVVFGTSAGYYAAGENGVYTTLGNTDPQPEAASTTHLADADIVDLFWPLPFDPEAIGGIELSGLTADGCAFDLKHTDIISCYEVPVLDGPVIGSTYWTVPMVSSGRFFLTEDRLYRFTIQEDAQ